MNFDLPLYGQLHPDQREQIDRFFRTREPVDDRKLFSDLMAALESGSAFSAVRFGDGEAMFLDSGSVYPEEARPFILNRWWGRSDFGVDDLSALADRLRTAFGSATYVGLTRPSSTSPKWFASIRVFLEYFSQTSPSLVDFNYSVGFLEKGLYERLLARRDRVIVIGPRDIRERLRFQYGIEQVDWIPVPEARVGSSYLSANNHFPKRFNELLASLMIPSSGCLVLVGAGVCGKVYCDVVRSQGGIALDVGSMCDFWGGVLSRGNWMRKLGIVESYQAFYRGTAPSPEKAESLMRLLCDTDSPHDALSFYKRLPPHCVTGLTRLFAAKAKRLVGLEKDANSLARAAAKDSENPYLLSEAAQLLAATGSLGIAIEFAEFATSLSPKQAHLWRTLGGLYTRDRRIEQAAAAFYRALELNPSDSGVLRQLSQISTRLGRASDAQEYSRRAESLAAHAEATKREKPMDQRLDAAMPIENNELKETLERVERKLLNHQRSVAQQLYRQLEALTSLYQFLNVRLPLPSMRGWAVSPDFAVLLAREIFRKKPRCVVELGGGVSTLISAYCLEVVGSGEVVAIEHNREYADLIREDIRDHALARVATVVHAPLKDVVLGEQTWKWYDRTRLQSLAGIDLLVVDGPPGNLQRLSRYPALPVLHEAISDRATILVDDARRNDEQQMIDRWQEEFDGWTAQSHPCEKGAVILSRAGSA